MLDRTKAGLCLVDVQGKLALQMHNSDLLIKRLSILLKGMDLLQIPVIWMEQLPDKLGSTLPELEMLLHGKPFAKSAFSGVKDQQIAEAIRNSGRTQWMIAGIESHVCVYQTAMDLLADNHKVWLVADAIGSRDENNQKVAVSEMQQAGVHLTSVEMALFSLKQYAGDDEFRQLLELIR